ncbi:hypothetical protein [uncultured Microscilla sp.]|uniref:hypothetical protein n=1 Tax=uncultured Microscilla sp. TaxID=432653 RepID=UPI00263745DD|nr:hypothetical protein [uncultured Microscilla sp.]
MDLISAIFRPEVMVFLVPITAIAGHYFYRAQKLKVGNQLSGEERKMLSHVMNENENLTNRVENLESIITGLDKELLQIKVSEDAKEVEDKVRKLADALKQG